MIPPNESFGDANAAWIMQKCQHLNGSRGDPSWTWTSRGTRSRLWPGPCLQPFCCIWTPPWFQRVPVRRPWGEMCSFQESLTVKLNVWVKSQIPVPIRENCYNVPVLGINTYSKDLMFCVVPAQGARFHPCDRKQSGSGPVLYGRLLDR